MSISISLRLPDNISKVLDKLCHDLDRPKSYIIRKALEKYINEYAEYQTALERLRNKEDKIISPKELRKSLGI